MRLGAEDFVLFSHVFMHVCARMPVCGYVHVCVEGQGWRTLLSYYST